jgi:hypothetical protein
LYTDPPIAMLQSHNTTPLLSRMPIPTSVYLLLMGGGVLATAEISGRATKVLGSVEFLERKRPLSAAKVRWSIAGVLRKLFGLLVSALHRMQWKCEQKV